MTAPLSNRDPVDLFGEVKAQMAELKEIHDNLRDLIAGRGPGAYEGELFRATVSVGQRNTLDMDAVREKLSAQFIRAHTNTVEVTTVKSTARKVAA